MQGNSNYKLKSLPTVQVKNENRCDDHDTDTYEENALESPVLQPTVYNDHSQVDARNAIEVAFRCHKLEQDSSQFGDVPVSHLLSNTWDDHKHNGSGIMREDVQSSHDTNSLSSPLDALALACAAHEHANLTGKDKNPLKTSSISAPRRGLSQDQDIAMGKEVRTVKSTQFILLPSQIQNDDTHSSPSPPSSNAVTSVQLANETVAPSPKDFERSHDNTISSPSQISVNDVLCGRGGLTNHHPGNVFFRKMVRHRQEAYLRASKRDKASVARHIVETIRKLAPAGRFLKKDPSKQGMWTEIGDRKAREKTSQALRENAPELREELQNSAPIGRQEQQRNRFHSKSQSEQENRPAPHVTVLQQPQLTTERNSSSGNGVVYNANSTSMICTSEEVQIKGRRNGHQWQPFALSSNYSNDLSNPHNQINLMVNPIASASLESHSSLRILSSDENCNSQKGKHLSGKIPSKRQKIIPSSSCTYHMDVRSPTLYTTSQGLCGIQAGGAEQPNPFSSHSMCLPVSTVQVQHERSEGSPSRLLATSDEVREGQTKRGPRLKMLKARSRFQHCI